MDEFREILTQEGFGDLPAHRKKGNAYDVVAYCLKDYCKWEWGDSATCGGFSTNICGLDYAACGGKQETDICDIDYDSTCYSTDICSVDCDWHGCGNDIFSV